MEKKHLSKPGNKLLVRKFLSVNSYTEFLLFLMTLMFLLHRMHWCGSKPVTLPAVLWSGCSS